MLLLLNMNTVVLKVNKCCCWWFGGDFFLYDLMVFYMIWWCPIRCWVSNGCCRLDVLGWNLYCSCNSRWILYFHQLVGCGTEWDKVRLNNNTSTLIIIDPLSKIQVSNILSKPYNKVSLFKKMSKYQPKSKSRMLRVNK